ncbi:3-ketoacyl-reductase [Stachybotrys elegans]|uniref:3-ketoacyl-reductase n=1 Tax=Stachybotrys elegans TaxID=80388 RepID=A0A8K0WRG0_9HYPO|nr:3-ketoacyl-reductase [Stachybotrys elegans]
MALRLAGKHCAVIGATGIIGSHIAKAFAANGAVVSLLSRTAPEARPKLEPELLPYKPTDSAPSDNPSVHRFIGLDVFQHNSIKEVMGGKKEGSAGPVDILVNCAGISQTTVMKRTPDSELRDIVDTNLLATMIVCKHANIRPHGCIINVSSLMAIKGVPGAAAYAASKAGVIGFTRALCRELSPRSIRVNALLPGWVDSPMWKQLKPELKEAYLRDTPLHRVAHPAEIADAAVFLAANSFANNCVLNIDGGLSAA